MSSDGTAAFDAHRRKALRIRLTRRDTRERAAHSARPAFTPRSAVGAVTVRAASSRSCRPSCATRVSAEPWLLRPGYFPMCMANLAPSRKAREAHRRSALGRHLSRPVDGGELSTCCENTRRIVADSGVSQRRGAAPRHLVAGERVRAGATECNTHGGRRLVPPTARGKKPQSGQERPPLRRLS